MNPVTSFTARKIVHRLWACFESVDVWDKVVDHDAILFGPSFSEVVDAVEQARLEEDHAGDVCKELGDLYNDPDCIWDSSLDYVWCNPKSKVEWVYKIYVGWGVAGVRGMVGAVAGGTSLQRSAVMVQEY